MLTVKGHQFKPMNPNGSSARRALQFKNNIITALKKLGVHEDDIEIELEPVAIRRAPASVSWYLSDSHLHFSYMNGKNFVENIYIVSKVIEAEVELVLNNQKHIEEFVNDFAEDEDIDELRKKARETLGVPADCKDLDLINQKYKELARTLHPDTGNGDPEKFKEVNTAHKILRKELGG